MINLDALRRELADHDAVGRRQDAIHLWDGRRSDLGWMLIGAGLVIGGAALLAGLLAVWRAVLGVLG